MISTFCTMTLSKLLSFSDFRLLLLNTCNLDNHEVMVYFRFLIQEIPLTDVKKFNVLMSAT
jgi:hypothetical protein